MKTNLRLSGKIVLSAILIFFARPAFGLTVNYEPAFRLNPVNEGIELGLGTLLSGSAFVCDKIVPIKTNNFNAEELKRSSIPDMDALFARPYSKPLHIVGTGTAAIALLTPAMFAVLPSSEWLTVGLMYTETLLFANGFKEWIKLLVYRARPYMYFDGYPQDKVTEGDWNCSFPSGHTTLAFAGAAFTTMAFCRYFPDSKWKYAVAGSAFGIATVTGILRMASGNHFFSDVLAGAFIGTVCGIAVPYFHTEYYYSKFKKNNNGVSLSANPLGFNISISLPGIL